jgi:hypothetical protein
VKSLYIDLFTPETIPMARVAGYMVSLQSCFGHCEHVHCARLKPGSWHIMDSAQ